MPKKQDRKNTEPKQASEKQKATDTKAGDAIDHIFDALDTESQGSIKKQDLLKVLARHGILEDDLRIKETIEALNKIGVLSPFDDGRVVLGRYELGQMAKEAGAISLESLTPDMADIKFRQAIALFPEDRERIQKFISTNIIGELLSGNEDTGVE